MTTCLITNPVSNANILVQHLKQRGIKCFAIIETDKVSQMPVLTTKKREEFKADLYEGIFTCESELPPPNSALFSAVLAGSENGVYLADKLCTYYGLPGNTPATTHLRRRKDAMQTALKNANLRHIPTVTLNRDTANELAKNWKHFPCVLKPISAAGGEGVYRCESSAELLSAIQDAPWNSYSSTWTLNDKFLLQPLVYGDEYVVDLVATHGTYTVSSICRYIRSNDLNISNCDFFKKFTLMLCPSSNFSQSIIRYAKQAAKALDINFGAVHMEIMMTETGPVMIEAGARMHGTITPTLFNYCYSAPMLDQLYEAYFGNVRSLRDAELTAPAVVSDIICTSEGTFEVSSNDLELSLKKFKSLKGFTCSITQGDTHKVTRNLFSSPMNACFCSTDVEGLWADVVEFDLYAERVLGGTKLSPTDSANLRKTYAKLRQN